ncbi:uncharacterized protein LOC111041362 isoform X2 [Myzus persicae]|uniref:uncharacterized protein LOC111041362 isoform X2 n=1 Tax=Myzus persicae TaxID=13164 RepID=UPI000B937B0B|nr:uncharacterized protein LOC111041362 isoform X2 [Myzus persicae]
MDVVAHHCHDSRAPPIVTPRNSESSSTRQTGHPTHPLSIRFSTLQTKAYATADLLRTIMSSNEFREGSNALHQLLAVLRPLIRAVGVISRPPPPPPSIKIEDETTTTTTTSTTPSSPIITCSPAVQVSSKKLMSLFVPVYAVPSTTTLRPLTGTLPKLFRKADS